MEYSDSRREKLARAITTLLISVDVFCPCNCNENKECERCFLDDFAEGLVSVFGNTVIGDEEDFKIADDLTENDKKLLDKIMGGKLNEEI